MKKALIILSLIFFSIESYAINIPVFNLPPNNYRLFTHHNEIPSNNMPGKQSITPQQQNNITISGIFQSQGEYFVLINHKVCKKGDTVEGFTIKNIDNNKVVFVKNGVETTKTLNKAPNIVFFTDDTISNDNDSKH